MANEFIARNGLIAQNNSIVTGSLTVSSSLEVIGSQIISGTLKVHGGNVDITSNAYFFQGINTLNGNVSLIGVNNQDQVYIGNQGYTNILADETHIRGDLQVTGSLYVTGSTVSIGGFTGSLFGTSSWAVNAVTSSYIQTAQTASYVLNAISSSYAATASYVNGIKTKANVITAGTFTGNPKKATVTFSTAFPNTNYSIVVTGEDSRTWTIESKLAGSFVVNSNSNVAPAGNTYWQATSYGEFNG